MNRKEIDCQSRRVRKSRPQSRWLFWGLSLLVTGCLAFILFAAVSDWIVDRDPEEPRTAGVAGTGSAVAAASGDTLRAAAQPEEDDGKWNLRLVNRWNALPENYSVELAEMPGGERVDKRIYEPLTEMLEAAREGNRDEVPQVISGYRTQEEQENMYREEIAQYKGEGYSDGGAEAEAQKWVAVPGTSEHQLGLAVDISGATYDVFLWLQENSWKYGFILRYPGDKTEITGKAEEIWHYRYVGREAAAEIYEQDLCLEEYLENLGKEEF